MTPFEVTQLSNEELSLKIRNLLVPDWCGCTIQMIWSDYDVMAWQCPLCNCLTCDDRFEERHMDIDFAQDPSTLSLLLDEMQANLSTFNGPGSGWRLFTDDKQPLTTGSGKELQRAAAEAFLVWKTDNL